MSLTNEQMKLVIKAEMGIKAVADFMAENRHVWDETRTLKLHYASSFCWQHEDEYPGIDLNDEFYWMCECEYEYFTQWADENNVDLRKTMRYIGRTSSFYLTDFQNHNGKRETKIDGDFIQSLYEEINGGYGFYKMKITDDFRIEFLNDLEEMPYNQDPWTIEDCFETEEEYLEYLADTETKSGFLHEIKYALEDAIKIADYIDDVKENQVDLFKEYLNRAVERIEEEKQREYDIENEEEFGNRDEELRFIVAGGIGV